MTVSNEISLQQVARLVQAGRWAEAKAASEALLLRDNDMAVRALLGAVCLRMAQFDEAVSHLRVALMAHPADRTVRANLADALHSTGRLQEALDICTGEAALADPTLRLARLRGFLAQSLGDFPAAIEMYRFVVRADPADWVSWNNLGNALTATGEFEESLEPLRRASSMQPDSAPVQMNLAEAMIDANRPEEAEAQLRQIADQFPDDVNPVFALFSLYRVQGRDEPAYDALSEALGRGPDNLDLLSAFVQESITRSQFAAAEAACDRALEIDPTLSQPYSNLASVYDRSNQLGRLPVLIERAERENAAPEAVNFVRAVHLKRLKKTEEAWHALQATGNLIKDIRLHQLTGQIQDERFNYDEAFAAFSAMNTEWLKDISKPEPRATMYRDSVRRATSLLTREWVDSWVPSDFVAERPSPISLIGFPRSGTTLLDTLLMGHSDVLVLEEEPYLAQLEFSVGQVEKWGTLAPTKLKELRRTYFDKIAVEHPMDPDSVVVDKHPLHLNKAIAIHRLFPDSKFIVALRHPCDVVLSCFMTSFRLNNAMSNFLALETAAELYDLTFTHWEAAVVAMNLQTKTVVYERLVADPERELRPLFDWLGLDWQPAVLDHQATASGRHHITTASYAQVVQPIYKSAAGRWRRYERHLQPILPILKPWVEKFGYSLDDDRIPHWPDSDG